MPKAPLYVLARGGGRVSKAQEERALELFQSSGQFVGLPEEVAEIANHCLDRGVGFNLASRSREDWTITRTR